MEKSEDVEVEGNVTDIGKARRKRPEGGHNKWLMNYELLSSKGKKGDLHDVKVGRSCQTIADELSRLWIDPLRRVGSDLFAVDKGKIFFIRSPAQLFAWIAAQGIRVDWAKNIDGAVSKDEFLCFLSQTADAYESISCRPHWPKLENTFYLPSVEIPNEETGALEQLVSMWTPATETDRLLMICAIITPFWGGRPGSRPCFVFDAEEGDVDGGRGVGKSKFTEAIAELAGGYIDLDLSVTGDEVKRRILSATTEGVIRYDNVKKSRASSESLEALITSPFISGHGFRQGLKRMPNHFTYLMTFNGVSMSKDLAKRTVHIKLRRPEYASGWEENVQHFIETRKADILADVKSYLEWEGPSWPIHLRFGAWERQVAQKVFNRELNQPGDVGQRQAAIDDDDNITEMIGECFEINISKFFRMSLGGRRALDPHGEHAIMIERRIATAWVSEYLGLKGQSMRGILKQIRRANVPHILDLDYKYGPQRWLVWSRSWESRSAYKISSSDSYVLPEDGFVTFSRVSGK